MALGLYSDTIVAPATAEGRSALGIVRLTGPDAIRITARIVGDPRRLVTVSSGSSAYLEILDSERAIVDDVVVHVYRAPKSFTGEDLVEIVCHGSPVILQAIVDLLVRAGARYAEPGEFSRRAFMHGKISPEAVEAIRTKVDAASSGFLKDSLGATRKKYELLRAAYDGLLILIAEINAEIDFGDSDSVELGSIEPRIRRVIDQLASLVSLSTVLRTNAGFITVALVGPPNVGKSSLFNALLRYERSIVSDTPGTTRDYLEAFLDIGGYRVKLLDTAGIRESSEEIEGKGIELGAEAALAADIVFRVTAPHERLPSHAPEVILLHNKRDLDGWLEGLSVSAVTGEGLESLHSLLIARLQDLSREASSISLSEAARSLVSQVSERLQATQSIDDPTLIVDQLRFALDSIGQLLGLNTSEESLNYIFSQMCIGK